MADHHYLDDSTRWNITNSAQNIVSALVDPSKQFDHVFRREWSSTFSNSVKTSSITSSSSSGKDIAKVAGSSSSSSSERTSADPFKGKLTRYIKRLEERERIKKCEAKAKKQQDAFIARQDQLLIPDIFLMENFELSKFKTFTQVISKVASPESPQLLTKNQIKELQQNLTDYLDLVEEKLANQVRNRSGDFFQVMSSVDSVMDELSLAIKSVSTLRLKCSTVNNNLITPHLNAIHHGRIKNNAKMVLDKLLELVDLLKVQPMIQLLLSTSDFDSALDMIGKTRILLHQEFRHIHCLKHLEPQLVEYERLIATMMQQEEKIVHKFHEEHKKRIESSLDSEHWKMVEIPKEFQHLITMLLDDNKSINEILEIIQETEQSKSTKQEDVSGRDMINDNNTTNNNNDKNYVTAMGSKYVVVNSAIILIEIVIDYCKCAQNIRASSADVLEYLFQILQIYNSRTYHLVYSAGAIQVAGLKTITTRCLIVSQRSLKLISLTIPALRRYFSKLLPDYTRLRRFEDIELSYKDHADKIPQRVNIIVKDVINLRLQEWEAKPPVPSAQFTAISQHLSRLHDNIQVALPLDELIILFSMIVNTFKDVLIMHLKRLNIKNDAGPQQWLVTQELTFFRISLAKLSVFKNWTLNFDDLWTRMNSGQQQQQPLDDDSSNGSHKDNSSEPAAAAAAIPATTKQQVAPMNASNLAQVKQTSTTTAQQQQQQMQ